MVFWNSLEIPEPPTNTCNVSSGVCLQNDIVKIRDVCSKAAKTLSKLEQLHLEAALLSRTMYKLKNVLRRQIGFKKLEKINRGLLKYLASDIKSVYVKFGRMMPLHAQGFEFGLPTRQMLEWVLVRTQGFAKLFCLIHDWCEETSCFWMFLLRKGHLLNKSLMLFAILSRIWTYARYLVKKSCGWFAELRPYLNVFQSKGIAWLPSGYELPEDLETWLNTPNITDTRNLEKDETHKTDNVFGFIDLESSVDFRDTSRLINIPAMHQTNVEDFGEIISRNNFNFQLAAASTELTNHLYKSETNLTSDEDNNSSDDTHQGTSNKLPLAKQMKRKRKVGKKKLLKSHTGPRLKSSNNYHSDESTNKCSSTKKKKCNESNTFPGMYVRNIQRESSEERPVKKIKKRHRKKKLSSSSKSVLESFKNETVNKVLLHDTIQQRKVKKKKKVAQQFDIHESKRTPLIGSDEHYSEKKIAKLKKLLLLHKHK